jgi:hypothetical protein
VSVCYGGICTVGVVVRAGKGGQAAQVYEPSGPLPACSIHTGQQSTRRSKKAVSKMRLAANGGMAGVAPYRDKRRATPAQVMPAVQPPGHWH